MISVFPNVAIRWRYGMQNLEKFYIHCDMDKFIFIPFARHIVVTSKSAGCYMTLNLSLILCKHQFPYL